MIYKAQETAPCSDDIIHLETSADITLIDNANLEHIKSSNVQTALEELDAKICDILYREITIDSFTNSVNVYEKGSVLNDVILSWSTNKLPTKLKIDGSDINPELNSIHLDNQKLTDTKTYTLTAIDERNFVVEKTTRIMFLNGVYYGVGNMVGGSRNFILSLTKKLQASRVITFTVTAGEDDYIWFAIPEEYGEPTFNVGGFEGGFTVCGFELSGTINFTNQSGFTEKYRVYRSDNKNLGQQTVKVY